MHRFYQPDCSGPSIIFTAAQSRQIAKVLRLKAGGEVEVFNGRGVRGIVVLTSVTLSHVEGSIRETAQVGWPFAWRAVLYLSLIRPQRFEWAIEKAAELGAWAIVPLLAERCTHGGETISAGRLARWQQIAIEAAEQCGSAFVPPVRAVSRLSEALAQPADLRLFAMEHDDAAQRSSLASALQQLPARRDSGIADIAILIGPEGGFTPAEAAEASDAGCSFVSLGPQILRADTAAVAALAVLAQD